MKIEGSPATNRIALRPHKTARLCSTAARGRPKPINKDASRYARRPHELNNIDKGSLTCVMVPALILQPCLHVGACSMGAAVWVIGGAGDARDSCCCSATRHAKCWPTRVSGLVIFAKYWWPWKAGRTQMGWWQR